MTPGAQVGRYSLVRELGRGGMGAVFVAHDPLLGREVALKVVLQADGRDLERFQREARAVAQLEHPGIVPVLEVGSHDGRPFMVLQLVGGQSLDRRLKERGPLPPAEAARIALDLCAALAHAHARGILHRDLKPANVLARPTGEVLLTDFGLAKDTSSRDDLTRTGELLGTPGYMAPEQADGAKEDQGERTDVYGLGATLYALLTAHAPFEGAGMPLLVTILNERPRAPSRLEAGVPAALDAVVLRCLAKRPEDRFASADELAAALRAAQVASARPAPSRLPRTALALIAGVVAIGGAFVLGRAAPGVAPPTPTMVGVSPGPAPGDVSPEPAPLAVTDAPVGTPDDGGWAWREAHPSPDAPHPGLLAGHDNGAVFDPRVGLIVSGGRHDQSTENTMWLWDGTSWTLSSQRLPDARYNHGLARDPTSGRLFLFGGSPDPRRDVLSAAFTLAPGGDATWRPLVAPGATEEPAPRDRICAGLVWAAQRRSFLLYGGLSNSKGVVLDDLWEWTESGGWRAHTTERRPPARYLTGMTWDANRGKLVVFGGTASDRAGRLGDLWEWEEPGGWRQIDAEGPLARTEPVFVFDGEGALLFGGKGAGEDYRSDLWRWDGGRWEELHPAGPLPTPRSRAASAWDARRRVLVVFGGVTGGRSIAKLADTWELDAPD